jgi:hypothetical protein
MFHINQRSHAARGTKKRAWRWEIVKASRTLRLARLVCAEVRANASRHLASFPKKIASASWISSLRHLTIVLLGGRFELG